MHLRRGPDGQRFPRFVKSRAAALRRGRRIQLVRSSTEKSQATNTPRESVNAVLEETNDCLFAVRPDRNLSKPHNKRKRCPLKSLKNAASVKSGASAAPPPFRERACWANVCFVRCFGVRLLRSFATSGSDAKNLLATRLLVSLPTGRIVSPFFRSRSWQGRLRPRSLLPKRVCRCG